MSFSPKNRTLARSGEGNGLYLVLHNFAVAFLTEEEQIDNLAGFRVTMHDLGYKPDLDSGFNVPFGYKTFAQMSVQTDVKLNRKTSPCEDKLPNVTYTVDYSIPGHFENQSYFGSTRDCVYHIMQEDYQKSCGCLATHLPLPSDLMNDTDVCHSLPEEVFFRDIFYRQNSFKLREYTIENNVSKKITLSSYLLNNWNIYNRTANFIKCYHTVRKRHETQGVVSKQCRVRCQNTRYDVTTSLASWPRKTSLASSALQGYANDIITEISGTNLSDHRLQTLRNDSKYFIKSKFISVLDLYPKSTKVTVSSESLAYPLRNLFSDLGGILGLWVGVSIITLLELIELLIQLAHLFLLKLRSSAKAKSQVSPPSKNSGVIHVDVLESTPRDIYRAEVTDKTELQLGVSLPSVD